jgi:hypothetical protein
MNTSERNGYLEVIDDSVLMTREVFIALMKKFRHHRSVSYGFSKKHTQDIQEYRKKLGMAKNDSTIPGNVYNLPITYNTSVTYVK